MILQVLHCLNCQGTNVIRHGTTRQGKQRYRCQETVCKGGQTPPDLVVKFQPIDNVDFILRLRWDPDRFWALQVSASTTSFDPTGGLSLNSPRATERGKSGLPFFRMGAGPVRPPSRS